MCQVCRIRIRKMREYTFHFDMPDTQGRLEQPLGAVPVSADAFHPGVDLQMYTGLDTH